MGIYQSLAGSVRVELTSADVAGSLAAINSMHIPLSDLKIDGELTVAFTIAYQHLKRLRHMADQRGDRIIVLSKDGTFWLLRRMKQRPVMLLCICTLLILAVILPTRVLFVEVEGNERLPNAMILDAAERSGIGFGISRRVVRSEKIKNQLLDALPQLQWAGVNTYGCTAVVTVRERSIESEDRMEHAVSNVIASTDGVITSCTVTAGTVLCQEGQVVKKGQILISGYSDFGNFISAGRGQGEIFANTRHEITAVSPAEPVVRTQISGKKIYYSLCLGKKRINFYKGSGISDGSCVKMITQYHLTLPGNYTLPVTLIKEEQIHCQTASREVNAAALKIHLSDFSKRIVRNTGIALSIIDVQETFDDRNGLYVLRSIYNCTEMIGREKGVQIGDSHGKTN